MTISQIPPISPPLVPAAAQSTASVSADVPKVDAKAVRLPENLNTTDRAITLKAEVVANNSDGTVRVATPRGPIDIKLPEGQTLQRGQTVEVEIPPGNQARTVTVSIPPQDQAAATRPQTPVQVAQPLASQTQTPNTPQDTVRTPTPLPQTPVQAAVTSAQQQIRNPAIFQSPQTPAPAQTAQPAATPSTTAPQSTAPTPATQPLITPQATPESVSPQGLMAFLKTSLQNVLKTPIVKTDGTQPQTPQQTVLTQRPLQLGQLVRLTPLFAQPAAPAGIQTPTLAAPALQTPQTLAPLASTTIAQTPQILTDALTPKLLSIPQPALQTTPQAQTTPLQTSIQTVLGQTVNLGTPVLQTAVANPATQLLLPLDGTPKIAFASPQATVTVTQQTQLAPPALSGLVVTDAQTPHLLMTAQNTVTMPTTPQNTPALPAMDVRVSGMMPTAALSTLQSPTVATLLHGTPTAPVVFATVTGQTAQGLPILEMSGFTMADDGTAKPVPTSFVLQFPARALTPATVLKLDVLPQTVPLGTTATSAATTAAQGINWESLDNAIRILHNEPQGATAIQNIQAALPKPAGAVAFTAPVLMMAAALRSGDVTQWLGEKTTDILKVTRRVDALARISGDFTATSRQLDDAPKGEWRALTVPLMVGHEIQHIHLHTRAFTRDDEGDKAQKKSGTRFVMDVNLTRMGPLQIDGFSLEKRLDVTLRTEQALSPPMRELMRARYNDALEGLGFAGQLNFNATPDHKHWVTFDTPTHHREASA